MLLAKDYIICRLTGRFVTDYSEASGTDAFDLRRLEWSREILDAAGISPEKMPELHASTDVIGTLLPDAAKALGAYGKRQRWYAAAGTVRVLLWVPEALRRARCFCLMALPHG